MPRSKAFQGNFKPCLAVPLLSCLGGLLAASTTLADCDQDIFCIHEEKVDAQVLVHAQNLTAFPLTYSLQFRGRDGGGGEPETVTRTLGAHQSQLALTLDNSQNRSLESFRYRYDWTIGSMDAMHDGEQVYQLPYESGKSYRVIQTYGSRFSHTGLEQYAIDFRMDVGTPVHAARSGVVARRVESNSVGCWRAGCGAHANFVVVLHDDGTTGEYYHLQQNGALVEIGERVFAGQKIALSGNTGHTTIPHLHFAVYRAIDWGKTQSIPVRFATTDGTLEHPRRGGRYQALPIRQASKEDTRESIAR